MTKKRKKNWRLVFKGSPDDFDPLSSLDYWLKRTPLEKFREVENLIRQAQAIKGITKTRSFLNLKARKRKAS